MNNRFISTILTGTIIILTGCSRDDIDVFPEERYVQFTTSVADTTPVSFFFYPNQDEVQYPLAVQLIGRMPETDIRFMVEVDPEATTARSEHYTLPNEFVFRSGLTTDTVYVTIKNTPEMLNTAFQLALQIVPADGVLSGQTPFTRRVLQLSNMASRPVWWDSTMESLYLGRYSDLKFRTFIEVTGVNDLSIYDPAEQRAFMLQFKYYLIDMRDAGTPVLEEDGTDMLSTVPIIG